MNQAKYQQEACGEQSEPRVERRKFIPSKRRAFAELHGVSTQKTVLNIITAVRT
jgi:hypothetical protein